VQIRRRLLGGFLASWKKPAPATQPAPVGGIRNPQDDLRRRATLFIEKGNYGNVRLDGLAVASSAKARRKTMMESLELELRLPA
jgi:hypothetical protein